MIKFGTGGFRGIIGDDFNKANIQAIAQALAHVVHEGKEIKPVALGYDNRFMSDFAARWFAEVLMGNNIPVMLTATSVPTPLVMMIVRDKGLDYGITMTASHNPYIYNGVKPFLKGGADADATFTEMLEKRIAEVKEIKTLSFSKGESAGLLQVIDYISNYVSCIETFLNPNAFHSPLKVLFNNLNGVGARSILPLAKDLDFAKFDALNTEHDAFFSFVDPNPTRENMMGEFREKVLEGGYDIGMAVDSDADRLGIIDEKGNYVDANEIMGCLYYGLIKYRGMKGDIVKNVATSTLIDGLAKAFGYRCIETDVGFKFISAAIKENNALIGGESSGGLTIRGYLYGKDSSFSGALFLNLIAAMGKPVSEVVKEVKEFANYHHEFVEDAVSFEGEPQKVMSYIESNDYSFAFPCLKKERISNNIRFWFDDNCFMLIRLSGTEKKFRVFAEMKDVPSAKTSIASLKSFIQEAEKANG